MPNFKMSSLAQYVVRNPFTTAAAVFTPIFAKNEDRGYFRTALITTPIIFATGEFVPKMFGGVRDFAKSTTDTKNFINKSEKWTRFEQTNFNDLNTLLKSPNITENVRERALSAWLVSDRRSRDFAKEQATLDKYFKRRFVKTSDLIGKANLGDAKALALIQEIDALHATKGRLITNAMHVARRSSLTPLEWSSEPGGIPSDVAGGELNDWMISQYNEFKGRPDFVKTLKQRLREVKNLSYSGTLKRGNDVLPTAVSGTDFEMGGEALDRLKAQSPGVYEGIEKALKKRSIVDATIVTSGDTGKLLNVSVTRKGNTKPLTIPLVDKATGQVRLGDNAIGVGNYVIGPDGAPHRIDEWISKMLAEQPKFSFGQLQEEINAHAYWFAGDPLDARRMSELESFGEEGKSLLHPQAIKLRSYGAGVTKLPLFDLANKKGVSFYDYDFDARNKVNFLKKLYNDSRYILMGSEAGAYEGRFQLREAAYLSPLGAPNAAKQDSIWRSVTKEFRLTPKGQLPDNNQLGWKASAWGEAELPAAKFTVAGINPQDRTLFSELPKTLDELHFDRTKVIQKFINSGLSTTEATNTYNDVYKMYQDGQQGVFSYLGGMGETGFVMSPDLADKFSVDSVSKYNVDELGIEAGAEVGPDRVMGFNRGERVTAKYRGVVQDIAEAPGGFVVNVRHSLGMQGAKLDVAGIKGMNRVTQTNEHFEQLRTLMNNFYDRLRSSGKDVEDSIPEGVNVLAPAEYFTNKVEPAQAYLGIGSDLVRRMPQDELTSGYLDKMKAEGIDWSNGQFVVNSSKLSTKNREASAKLIRLGEINEEFFSKAGEAIKNAGGYEDPVLTAFVNSGKDLGNWMLKNQLPAMAFSWNHSLANVPRFSGYTYDVDTYMALGGNLKGLKAIRSRLQTVSGGNPGQALDFVKSLMSGNTDGLETIPLKGAFTSRGSLNTAGNRAGSIFDPSIDKYKKNFRLDLGNGEYLPVPGTEAYGAEGSQFGPGEYQPRAWQSAIQDLAYETSPEEIARLKGTISEEYQKQFAFGKGSALRPYQYDPNGVPGFLSTTAEQGDPFVAKVSREWAEKAHSKRIRRALLQGEEVLGILHRQPTNELMYLKYKVDETLNGTMDVAVPESISRAYMGDQDQDLVNSFLIDANVRTENGKMIVTEAANSMERDAANEAIEAMGDKQRKQLAIWQSLKGDEEIAAKASVNWELTKLAEKNAKFAKDVSNRVGIAVNRTAGASIGAYSNVLTEMVENMVRSPKLMQDPDLIQRLKTGLFDIRQAPISARKAHVSFDLETAMRMIDNLKTGMNDENPVAAASKMQSVLLTMSKTLDPAAENSRAYGYWASEGAEDIKKLAAGRSEKARLMSELFTSGKGDGPISRKASRAMKEAYKDIESTIGAIHGGRMADDVASKIGMISEHLINKGRDAGASVTGRIGKIFSEHGGALALGLGSLAALGIALTPRTAPVATFSRSSGNKFRPEDRMGVADNIPGEPVPGQMAPSNPPRRMGVAVPGVRTAVVAPLDSTSDLSVRMRATDQSRAAETARQIAQIPGSGHSNVTINYRDRTRIGSLRTREKIREIIG